jgi:hypothetical protein
MKNNSDRKHNHIKRGLISGFFGGVVSGLLTYLVAPYVRNNLGMAADLAKVDPVSIANTFIVFTTIIFVAITLLLALAGLAFTQSFSTAKHLQLDSVLDDLKERLETDGDFAVDFVSKALNNPDAVRLIEEKVLEKVKATLEQQGNEVSNNAKAIEKLSQQIGKGT